MFYKTTSEAASKKIFLVYFIWRVSNLCGECGALAIYVKNWCVDEDFTYMSHIKPSPF